MSARARAIGAEAVETDEQTQATNAANADPYEGDLAAQLIRDTLTDRGHDPEAVAQAMEEYGGDFWFDFGGPMIDRAGEAIGLGAYPDDERGTE